MHRFFECLAGLGQCVEYHATDSFAVNLDFFRLGACHLFESLEHHPFVEHCIELVARIASVRFV